MIKLEDVYYTPEELLKIGFEEVGDDVLISRKTSIYMPEKMKIGNHVTIDDYTFLSGNIIIGNYVHISSFCALYAGHTGIEFDDFSGMSANSIIYAISDDYSGEFMVGACAPVKHRNVIKKKVYIGKHAILGTGTTVLPGGELGEGSVSGANSLVKKPLEPWGIYAGSPCKKIKDRSKKCLKLGKEITNE